MLVKFTDSKGKEVWVNPIHVKLIEQRRQTTIIVLGPGATASGGSSIKVREPIDLVAEILNAAMPDMAYVPDDAASSGVHGGAAAASGAAGAAGAIATMG